MKAIFCVVLSFAAMALLYVAMPFLSAAFSLVYLTVGFLATLIFVVGLPLAAWTYGKGEFDRKYPPACLAVLATCLVCWTTIPKVEITERDGVVGIIEHMEVTGEKTFHCFDDAISHARVLYKDRSSWAKDDTGKFADCDVKITVYQTKPCFDRINKFLGTNYGITSYTTSLRLNDYQEDPLQITDYSREWMRDSGEEDPADQATSGL